jgi:CubicO group peptidase (beta-lactamase class C family)
MSSDSPAPKALTTSDFPGVKALIERHVAAKDVAGIVVAAAIGDDEPAFISAGETGFNTGKAVGPDSIHRIFSQTKPVTGISIMMLIEEGLIGLDQPLGEIIPELANLHVLADPNAGIVREPKVLPTVRHLLTHTAGFSYALQMDPIGARYRAQGIEPGYRVQAHRTEGAPVLRDTQDFIERLSQLPLSYDPGEIWHYSVGIDVLGAIVERISKKTLGAFFAERIFGPLGMVDTGFVVPPEKTKRLVTLPERRGEEWIVADDPADSAYAKPTMESGGGALVSTARDYMRFTAMLAGEGETRGVRLLRPDTVRLARSNMMPMGLSMQFFGNVLTGMGHGAAMQVPHYAAAMPAGVFGWGGAAGTGMWVDPAHKLHIVLMTQYWPAEINLSLRESPANAVYADLGLWPAGPRTSLTERRAARVLN